MTATLDTPTTDTFTPSEDDLLLMAFDLLAEHELDEDWTIEFTNSRRAYGRCDYANERILLSRHHIDAESLTFEQWDDVIRHEIAHVLAGPRADKHGPIWRKYAVQVGATPRAAITPTSTNAYKWRGVCPACGAVVAHRFRLAKTMHNSLYHPTCWDETSTEPIPYVRWEPNTPTTA